MTKSSKIYDLAERTAKFGDSIIQFVSTLNQNPINRPLISQIVRSATSIGANYAEANNAASKKDFRNKIIIAKKEIQETKHWLRMIKSANPDIETQELEKENMELIYIFQKIIKSLENSQN